MYFIFVPEASVPITSHLANHKEAQQSEYEAATVSAQGDYTMSR